MSKKHEYVAEVLHHEEEELVSIIMDYKTAAKLQWLVGQVRYDDSVGHLYDRLQCTLVLERFLDKLSDEKEDLGCIEFPDMGEW